jgi:hypothetical protein
LTAAALPPVSIALDADAHFSSCSSISSWTASRDRRAAPVTAEEVFFDVTRILIRFRRQESMRTEHSSGGRRRIELKRAWRSGTWMGVGRSGEELKESKTSERKVRKI